MKQLTCEICGGNDLLKQDGVFVCQSCGCKYSAQEVKKLMVQISEPVKVEGINSVEEQLENVRQLILIGKIKAATDILNELVVQAPSRWEVWYEQAHIEQVEYLCNTNAEITKYSTGKTGYDLCKDYIEGCFQNALKCKDISDSLKNKFRKLNNIVENEHEKRVKIINQKRESFLKSLYDVPSSCSIIGNEYGDIFYWNNKKYHAGLNDLNNNNSDFNIYTQEWKEIFGYQYKQEIRAFVKDGVENAEKILKLCGAERVILKNKGGKDKISANDRWYFNRDKIITYLCGKPSLDEIKTKFKDNGCPKNYDRIYGLNLWDIAFINGYTIILRKSSNYSNEYITYPTKIKVEKNTDTIYKNANNCNVERKYDTKSGCYIATSVYGSYDCPEVWTLRRYRDYTLAHTWYGRAFIRTYYTISPILVKLFGHTSWFQSFWKNRLDRMVCDLKNKGFEDKPYDDRKW